MLAEYREKLAFVGTPKKNVKNKKKVGKKVCKKKLPTYADVYFWHDVKS